MNVYSDSAINLTRNPGELHIDHLHILSLLSLHVIIDQDYSTEIIKLEHANYRIR